MSKPLAYSYLRMSTDIQLKGDSRRRQLDASQAYAEANALELAQERQLEDIGVSAFKGANVKDGALGRFLEAAESGRVPKGSYLLVENLDRLTRQKINDGLALFLRIINAGINVVTLTDKRLFKAGEPDLTDLIVSLVTMSRAHDESVMKSKRGSANWENKRAKAANGEPMTKWSPSWLRRSDDGKRYEVIPERADVVRRIYKYAASGMGMGRITLRLNQSRTPTFSPSNGWYPSYIAKILANRAVLGECQPNKVVEGKYVPEGDVILDYYPAIIDRDLFYRALSGKAERRVNGRGRKGPGFSNLFGGMAKCAYCNSTMKFENKGSSSKGGSYLICDSAKRQLGCKSLRWKYKDFEASFLAFVKEVDVRSLLAPTDEAAMRAKLNSEITSLEGEKASLDALMEKTFKLLENSGIEFVQKKLEHLQAESRRLSLLLEAKLDEKVELETQQAVLVSSRNEIEELVRHLQEAPFEEIYGIRAQIASRLKTIVRSLQVASLGETGIERIPDGMTFRDLAQSPEHVMINVVSQMAELGEVEKPRRYFAVGFERAATRIVYPSADDPLRYDIHVELGRDSSFKINRDGPAVMVAE